MKSSRRWNMFIRTAQKPGAKRAKVAERMKDWEWGNLNEKFLQIVCERKAKTA